MSEGVRWPLGGMEWLGGMDCTFRALQFEYSVSNSLMGSLGKGLLQKRFRKFRRNFRNFPQNFRTLSWRTKAYFLQMSAEFPQTFRKKTLRYRPISELNIQSLKWKLPTKSLFRWNFSQYLFLQFNLKHGFPDPPILAFFDFLAFFVFRFPLLFCAFFLYFPRILGFPRREKP